MRFSRLFVYLLALIPLSAPYRVPAQSNSQLPPVAKQLDIEFTGKLFGYYRIRYNSTQTSWLQPVQDFFDMKSRGPKGPLLLGMGDNFAPEFGARLQETADLSDQCYLPLKPFPGSAAVRRPESFFKSEQRMVAHAACDSVANFLEKAGYRAVVPGREDFLYGAGWLRNIRLLLAQDKTTIMLGANLRILEDKPEKLPVASWTPCGLLFGEYSGINGGAKRGAGSEAVEPGTGLSQLCSNKGYDLSSGHSIVPEKFRLLRELDMWIEEPDSHPDSTELNSETGAAIETGNVIVNDRSKLLETTTRRELLVRDLIEVFWLSLPNCALPDSTEASPTLSKVRNGLWPLLRDYEYGELPATKQDWLVAENDLSPLGGTPLEDLCGGKAQSGTEAASAKLLEKLADFGVALRRVLDQERNFETEVREGFAKYKQKPNVAPAESKEASKKELTVVEPGVLAFDQAAAMLQSARTALLLAIAAEQSDVGFTETTALDQAGKPFKVLVVGVVGTETMQSVQDASLDLMLCPGKPGAVCSSGPVNPPANATKFKVNVTDPVRTVEAVIRAAQAKNGGEYPVTILMAQMPHAEVEELATRIRSDAIRLSKKEQAIDVPRLDIAISEAQEDHATSNIRLEYGAETSDLVPVVTPKPAYEWETGGLARPITEASLTLSKEARSVIVCQTDIVPADADKPDTCKAATGKADTVPADTGKATHTNSAMSLLAAELPNPDKYQLSGIEDKANGDKATIGNTCTCDRVTGSTREECNLAAMHAVLALLASRGAADLAMLERRDLFLRELPPQYDGYEMCDPAKDAHLEPVGPTDPVRPTDPAAKECRLRVALARVLWRGDQAAKIMVSGKDLAGALQKAQDYSDNWSGLTSTDISQQYLQTAGVVDPITGSPALSSVEFSVQSSRDCHDPEEEAKPTAGGTRMYCVNGTPLQADHGYWVITSSHIATEQTEYGLSGTNPADYLAKSKSPAKSLIDLAVEAGEKPVRDADIAKAELDQQQAKIFHIDMGKIMVGYNFQGPVGGSANIINRFQGVSDATASSAGSANLDLEQKERTAWEFKALGLGIQDDFEFNRQVQDNLLGKFVNGNFTKNLFSVGPFLLFEVPIRILPWQKGERWFTLQHDSKALPRWLFVLAPIQFQTQITGSHLNFPANSGQSQVSYVGHRADGLGERVGIRHEFDGGKWWLPDKTSYFETGGQFVQQRQVLASLTFSIPGLPPVVCPANGAQSFANCAPPPKTPTFSVSGEQYASKNQYGWYWDIHIQKGLFGKTYDKSTDRVTLTLDSKGDFFKDRGLNHAFSTQTWYDAPASVALVFPVFRNLGFAPTYTAYFYSNQVAENYLLVNTFSVNLRWYFDRDSHVPMGRSLLFKGPASADETTPAKTK